MPATTDDAPTAWIVSYYTTDADGNVWDYQTNPTPFTDLAVVEAECDRLERAGFCVDVHPCWGPQ